MARGSIIPWNRNRYGLRKREETPFTSLQQEMNRLFDEFFSDWEAPLARRTATFMPSVNVSENENEIKVSAELPGMDPEDVNVQVERDRLIIQGEKRDESEREEENYYAMERSFGSFYRAIPLPTGMIKQDEVEANFKNGVLTITLPKQEEARSQTRRISVKSE